MKYPCPIATYSCTFRGSGRGGGGGGGGVGGGGGGGVAVVVVVEMQNGLNMCMNVTLRHPLTLFKKAKKSISTTMHICQYK